MNNTKHSRQGTGAEKQGSSQYSSKKNKKDATASSKANPGRFMTKKEKEAREALERRAKLMIEKRARMKQLEQEIEEMKELVEQEHQ